MPSPSVFGGLKFRTVGKAWLCWNFRRIQMVLWQPIRTVVCVLRMFLDFRNCFLRKCFLAPVLKKERKEKRLRQWKTYFPFRTDLSGGLGPQHAPCFCISQFFWRKKIKKTKFYFQSARVVHHFLFHFRNFSHDNFLILFVRMQKPNNTQIFCSRCFFSWLMPIPPILLVRSFFWILIGNVAAVYVFYGGFSTHPFLFLFRTFGLVSRKFRVRFRVLFFRVFFVCGCCLFHLGVFFSFFWYNK